MRLFPAGAVAALGLAAVLAGSPASAAPTFFGPSPYLSFADSPFNPAAYSHFYLEDFEDGALNTPGLKAQGPNICIGGGDCFLGSHLFDSVGNGGNPDVGHSLYADGLITITFDESVLGSLPTAAGLVWTDGNNPITFTAYDRNNVLLGTLTGNHADGFITGQTAEDRFYGVTNPEGILKLIISNPPGIEIDHIQYGIGAAAIDERPGVPEPATWALMLTGFFGAGGALRASRRRTAATALQLS
jgi:hypothetical protein